MKIRKLLAAVCGCCALLFGTTAAQAVEEAAVAKIGEAKYSSLAAALNAAIEANDGADFTKVEIIDDVVFTDSDAWSPIVFKAQKRIEVVGTGENRKIVGLPKSLFTTAGAANSGQMLRMRNLKFEKPKAENPGDYASAVIMGYCDVAAELTFENVWIDHATVSAKKHAGAFLGFVALYAPEHRVTLTNCKVTNSRITSDEGSVGALAGHANGGYVGTVTVVDCEVSGNVISYTTPDEGGLKGGAVFGTIGNAPVSVSANVSSNTVTSAGTSVTTVYGRQGSAGGTLTLTGGTYDARPFNEGDDWAKVAKGYDMKANGDGTYGVTAHVVAKVGGEEFNSLAAALTAAVAAKDATVEIVDDITFDEGDTWTPVALKPGSTLVVKGNGKTIKNLPGMLLDAPNGGAERLRMSDLKFESPKAVNSGSDYVAVILGYADSMVELTFANVSIEGATVTGNDFVAAFVAYAALVVGDSRVTFTNCAVKGSTLTGGGSTGALMGHANGSVSGTVTVVDCEISGNTITCTKAASKKAGAVFGTVGDAPAFVSANVSGNTVKSGDNPIATIYGRQGSAGGRLTVTGGTYDARPFNEGDDWAKVAKGYDMTANGDGTYGVSAHAVAKVGGEEFNSLAAALTAAVAAKDATVEIVDDITFDEGDTWTPVKIGAGKTLVIKGNGKTIKNLPGCLFGSTFDTGDVQDGSVFTMTNLKFEKPKASALASSGNQFVAVVLAQAYGMDVTFDGVEIDGADVRGGNDSYVAGFVGWCNGMSGRNTVTLRNCALRNSTLVSCGSVGGLVAYTTVTPEQAVSLVVENCEVTGNTIVGTELKDGKPRTDIVGSVVGSIGAGDATVSAKVSGNEVYGSTSAVDAETLTKATDEVTTVYGRGKGGRLTLTGGTYDARPFNEGDDWAKVDEWCTLVGQDGLFKVVDNLATLGNVKARQRYPWNGLVDITFELKSKNAARIFIVAEYMDGGVTKRLTMTTAKLVNDDKTESEVNVSTGFDVPAQATAKTIHVIWDSTEAVSTRLSGVTFKVYAK